MNDPQDFFSHWIGWTILAAFIVVLVVYTLT